MLHFVYKSAASAVSPLYKAKGAFFLHELLIACTERLPCPSATRPLSEVEGQGPRSRRVAEVFIVNCLLGIVIGAGGHSSHGRQSHSSRT